jgi:DNA repair exonuclease SbcCD ATPase subunit
MKIHSITASNYQRLTSAHIALGAPILLLAGENEQGKTSLADAIYHAMTGIARRVSLKKDFGDLVHDGQKKGIVSVEVASDEPENGQFTVTIPNDKRTVEGVDEQPLLQHLLDPKRFVALKPEDRRTLLFGVTGKRITGKRILEELQKKGADPKKTAEVGAVLLAGFKAGHDEAKTKASEARGSWKAITGETYGSKKAEDWKAPKPEYDGERIPKLEQGIAEASAKISACDQQLGAMDAQRKAAREQHARRNALVELVDQTERRAAKLATDQQMLDEWIAKVEETRRKAGTGPKVDPMTCPHCAGMVELHGKTLVQHDPGKSGDPQAIALLPQQEQTLQRLTHARDLSKGALEQSQTAKAQLTELDANPAQPPNEEEAAVTAAQKTAHEHSRRALQETLDGIRAAKAKADAADANTAKAAGFHKDVTEWEQIADWLAPSGIQSELLTDALQPFNERLANTARLTGWDLVSIDAEMTIRIAGRAYGLCSESAKWRAEAAVTEALAFVSGVKTFLLDAVEILVGPNRIAFLTWMHHIAAAGEVDTAILIGSFKEPPKCPPTFQVEWVNAGMVGQQQLAEAA